MDVSHFDYDLPPQSIAQEPAEPRDASKLLVLDRARGGWEDAHFYDLPRWLEPGDCLVVNESRVIPARLLGTLRSEEHTSELQSRENLVCRLLLEKKKKKLFHPSYLKKKKKQ